MWYTIQEANSLQRGYSEMFFTNLFLLCSIVSFSHAIAMRMKVADWKRGNSGKIEGGCQQTSILTDFRLVMSALVICR